MLSPISLTGAGAIITVIQLALQWLGVEFPKGSVEAAVNGIVAAVGLVLLVYGQWRRGDLKFGLLRRP